MKKCAKCGADTVLFVNGIPLCVRCDTELEEAQARKQAHPPGSAPTPEHEPDREHGQEPHRRTTFLFYAEAVRRYREDVRRNCAELRHRVRRASA